MTVAEFPTAAFHDAEFDADPARLDRDAVWSFLSTDAYWGRWRTRADVDAQLATAWRVVGCYVDGRQVGFARAVSDGVALAWLADVYVLPTHRGRDLGRGLLAAMIDDGPGRDFRWLLTTADAHSLYREFGFGPAGSSLLDRPSRQAPERTGRDAELAAVWAGAADRDDADVLADVLALVGDADDAVADFERACAHDYAGREAEAEPAYRAALAAGLDVERRAQAVVQLASTVRNLGRPDEAAALLGPDADVTGHRDAATAFRALALTDLGRPRTAVRELLDALAPHLPQYSGAVRAYARALGPSVTLRAVTDDAGLDALVAVAREDADPDDVTPPLGDGWTVARVDWLRSYHRDRVDGLAGAPAELAWAVEVDGAVRGGARLRHLGPGRYETGLWLGRGARRQGIGRAVLATVLDVARTLGARELVATTATSNEGARALLRGAGFALEGERASLRVR